MAELNNKIFGSIKGSLGDVVFRSRNEKNYIARKPKAYSAPGDSGFIERTGKFKMAVKLASAINSFFLLKKIWKDNSAAGKASFTRILQMNYPFVTENNFTNMVKMTPRSSFAVNLQNLSMTNQSLNIELAALSAASNINASVEKKIQILAIVFLYNPLHDGLPEFDFLKLLSLKLDIDNVNPLTFNIPLLTADSEIAANYGSSKIIFAAVTFDSEDALVQFSSTINHAVD